MTRQMIYLAGSWRNHRKAIFTLFPVSESQCRRRPASLLGTAPAALCAYALHRKFPRQNGNTKQLPMPRMRLDAVGGISNRQQSHRHKIIRNFKQIPCFLMIKRADPCSGQSQLRNLQHHMGGDNAGIHIAADGAVRLVLPDGGFIVADHQREWRVKVVGWTLFELSKRSFVLDHKNPLGLIIAGSGRNAPGLQNQIQLLFLYRLVFELSDRISLFFC